MNFSFIKTTALTLIWAALAFESQAQSVQWVSSTANAPWVAQKDIALGTNRDDAPYDLVVRLDKPQQKMKLAADGNFDDAMAFRRPDGGVVVVLANRQAIPRRVEVKVGENTFAVQILANTFNTFCLEVASDKPSKK